MFRLSNNISISWNCPFLKTTYPFMLLISFLMVRTPSLSISGGEWGRVWFFCTVREIPRLRYCWGMSLRGHKRFLFRLKQEGEHFRLIVQVFIRIRINHLKAFWMNLEIILIFCFCFWRICAQGSKLLLEQYLSFFKAFAIYHVWKTIRFICCPGFYFQAV